MKEIILISDFDISEVNGGAELCNNALIEFLKEKECSVQFQKTTEVTKFQKDKSYIFANVALINQEIFNELIEENIDYRIYLHDHYYCNYRNPFRHNKQLICDCYDKNSLRHMFFFFAKSVLCQTKFHKLIVDQNVYCNSINVGSNLWTKEEIDWIKKCKKNKSNGKYIIFSSNYAHKNTNGAIEYAKQNNLKYDLISNLNWKDYIEILSKSEGIIFLPVLAESASRLVFEAKALNKKVITNKLVGYVWEDWWSNDNIDIEEIINNAKNNIFSDLNKKNVDVSVFCTTYNSEKYIDGYLKNISSFIKTNYEVIIYDGGSTDKTVEKISNFINENKLQNLIKLYTSEEKIGVYKGWNKALSKCRANLVINMNVDDRFSVETLYKLKEFLYEKNVDIVYSDSFVTKTENETFENHTCINELIWPEYNKDLIKKMCFCGHYPMFKKKILLKTGLFDENFKSAGDWDMWIRMSNVGAKFGKLNEKLGLYLFANNGVSTTNNSASEINIIESTIIRERYSKL